MRKNQSMKISRYLPMLIILLAITIMVGSTFAYFSDKTDKESDLNFSKVELSNETSIGFNGEILDCFPGSKIIEEPLSFSKAIDSAPIYVRAKLSFSLPTQYRDDVKMQELLNSIRYSSDVNVFNETQNDAVWSSKQGSYFYLLDKNNPKKLKVVDDAYTYKFSDAITLPRDLEALEENYQYMKSINFHVAFEAVQASNVSDDLIKGKQIFNEVFPGVETFGATVYVTVKDFNLVDTMEILEYSEGDILYEPIIDMPVDENGNSIRSIEGWFTDATLQTPYVFGDKIYEDLTLYPYSVPIAIGLEFIPIYNEAGSDIVAYKVAVGSCTDNDITIPSWYNRKPVIAIAENGFSQCDNITSITLSSKITTIEANAFSGCTSITNIVIPSSVTSIGEDAFLGCDNIVGTYSQSLEGWLNIEFANENSNPINNSKNLYIVNAKSRQSSSGDFVARQSASTSINATLLTHLDPPESISKIYAYAFYNCQSLLSMNFKENITEIGEFAFYGCFNVTDVNVTGEPIIGDDAFGECEKLEKIPISSNPTAGGYSGSNITSAVVPDGVTKIRDGGFSGCKNLTSVTLPSTLTEIGSNAFNGCISLERIIIPASVTRIGGGAFGGCTNLKKIIIVSDDTDDEDGKKREFEEDIFDETPIEDVEVIGKYALEVWLSIVFKNEYSNPIYYAKKLKLNGNLLTNLVIPASITEINAYVFINCESIVSTIVSSQVTKINEKAFLGCINNKSVTNNSTLDIVSGLATHGYVAYYTLESGLAYTEIVINNKVTAYKVSQGICVLSEIAIPGTYKGCPVTYVAASGFANNDRITSVILPDSIIGIEDYAFQNCTALKSINIPKNVVSHGAQIFQGCTNLETLYFNAINMSSFSSYDYSFENVGINLGKFDVIIGSSVENIPVNIFTSCKEQVNIIFKETTKLTTIGASAFSGVTSITEFNLPESVTTIGSSAFYGCNNLIEVVINDKITSIGSGAFSNCENLESVKLPSGMTTIPNSLFSGCTKLKNVILPKGITQIGEYAFSYCEELENIEISNKVTSIGEGAFRHCYALTEVTIPENITTLNYQLFQNGYNISKIYYNAINATTSSTYSEPFEAAGKDTDGIQLIIGNKVKYLPNYLLSLCTKVKSVEFEDGSVCESIGREMFKNNTLIDKIQLPDTIRNIYHQAFYGCTNLKDINFPNSLKYIEIEAFYNCTSITSIEIPVGVYYIGNYAFYNCTSVENIKYNAQKFSNNPYNNNYIFANVGSAVENLSLVIGNSVESIPNFIFYPNSDNLPNITSVTFEDDSICTNIGNYSFACTNIKSINLPNSLIKIGESAFRLSSLETIDLPSSLTTIGANAFYLNSSLTDITIAGKITSVGQNVFTGCNKVTNIYYNCEDVVANGSTLLFSCGDADTGVTLTVGENVNKIPANLFKSSNVKNVIFKGNKVETIGNYAFNGSKVESLVLPEGITTIGTYAFENTENLNSVQFPSSLKTINNYAFSRSNLSNLELPNGIETIGNSTFSNCALLESVVLPNNITSLGTNIFAYCSVLKEIELGNMATIPNNLLYSCSALENIVIPNTVTAIGNNAFEYCSSLVKIELPNTVLTLGTYVFSYCSKLAEVKLSTGLTEISNYTFYNCRALTNIDLHEGILKIGNYAFCNSGLSSIDFPSSITSIGDGAFAICNSLTSVELTQNIETIGIGVFKDCASLTSATINSNLNDIVVTTSSDGVFCETCGKNNGLTVTISANVTRIPDYIFYRATYLKSVVILGENVSIGKNVFYNSGLKSLDLSGSIISVGESSFSFSNKLVLLNLSNSITTFDADFNNCSKLNYILCDGEAVSSLVSGKGKNDNCIYVLQENGYDSSLTETEVVVSDELTIFTLTDADGYKWVKTGNETEGFKYYKAIAV